MKGLEVKIESTPVNPFSIDLIKNNERYKIQEIFDDTFESLNESLNKIGKFSKKYCKDKDSEDSKNSKDSY